MLISNQRGFGLYGYLIAGAIAAAIILGVWTAVKLHFAERDHLQAQLEKKQVVITGLKEVIATKDLALAKKDEQIELKELEVNGLLNSLVTVTASQVQMTEDMNRIRAEAAESQRIFAEHDVPKLMEAKPEWMTKIMQAGTREAWAELGRAVNQ